MLYCFVAYLYPGVHSPELVSEEMLAHSKVQVMTLAQAEKLGFSGVPPHPDGGEVWLIMGRKQDVNWLQRSLDSNPAVAQYQMVEVDL